MDRKDKAKLLDTFTELSTDWLYRSVAKKELSYLESRFPKENIKKYRFGYFPDSSDEFDSFVDEFGKVTKLDPIETLASVGLVYVSKINKKVRPFYQYHTLLIPFFNVYGKIISFAARSLLSQEKQDELKIGKYKYLPYSKRNHLFGLNYTYENILRKNEAIITEGQFDFYSAYLKGVDNIISCGCAKLTFEQIALLKRFTNNFIIIFDNDDAGKEGCIKAKRDASLYKFSARCLALPTEYNDLDNYVNSTAFVNSDIYKLNCREL